MQDTTGTAEVKAEKRAALGRAWDEFATLAKEILDEEQEQKTEGGDGAAEVLELAEVVARAYMGSQGLLLMALARARQRGKVRGGADAWVASHLDVLRGTALGIAKQAKVLGAVPELSASLASGKIGVGTITALTHTAQAVRHEDTETQSAALAETLKIAQEQGPERAKRHVQVLQETLTPGKAGQDLAKARERSFLRIRPTDSGMVWVEGLLDPVRATVVRAVLDQSVAAILRARQYDGTELVAQDVYSTEQVQAEVLVWMAQYFAQAGSAGRGLDFTLPTLYSAPLDDGQDAGLAESAYGDMVDRRILPQPGTEGARLLEHDENGQPVLLDHKPLDQNPAARLASADQRTALAWRDKHCTYPGCTEPGPHALHAHHEVPFSEGGATTVENLTLVCPRHHVAIHQEMG
jgi:hypothetical protein